MLGRVLRAIVKGIELASLEQDSSSSNHSNAHERRGSGSTRDKLRRTQQRKSTTGRTHAGTLIERATGVRVVAVAWDGGEDGTPRDRGRRKDTGGGRGVAGDDLYTSVGGRDTGTTAGSRLTLFEVRRLRRCCCVGVC